MIDEFFSISLEYTQNIGFTDELQKNETQVKNIVLQQSLFDTK